MIEFKKHPTDWWEDQKMYENYLRNKRRLNVKYLRNNRRLGVTYKFVNLEKYEIKVLRLKQKMRREFLVRALR